MINDDFKRNVYILCKEDLVYIFLYESICNDEYKIKLGSTCSLTVAVLIFHVSLHDKQQSAHRDWDQAGRIFLSDV